LFYEIVSTLVLGFLIGLTGALAPGPTLVATINASLAGDWTAGLKVSLGHIIIETAIFFLIILGLAGFAAPYTTAIAMIGGIALIVFGILTISGSRSASLSAAPEKAAASPYMAGLLTSAANPYFWIWWLSVGSALLIQALAGGLMLAVVFMIGHWAADISWYVLVSTGISKGRTILSDTTYHRIMAACGVFLVMFGLYYLTGPILSRAGT
jgi:threonine/homoserine/homoserine lactone efflux protein